MSDCKWQSKKKGRTVKTRLITLDSISIRAAATLVVAAAALLAITAAPAYGITTPASGSPGQVSFTTTVSAQHFFPYTPSIVLGGTTVYRSPAYAGTQSVTVTYAVYSNTGGQWEVSRSSTRSVQLSAGYSGSFPGLSFNGLFPGNGYKAMIVVEWKTPSGTPLGTRVINYDGNSDYRCYTSSYARCTVLQQPRRLGRIRRILDRLASNLARSVATAAGRRPSYI